MKVFISWSGEIGKQVAKFLRNEWLEYILDGIEPWMSDSDIATGLPWFSEIRKSLATTNYGIVCLTPENLHAPWIHFEAGSITKAQEGTLALFLVGVEKSEVPNPLGMFQAATATDKVEVRKLVMDLNIAIGDRARKEQVVAHRFDTSYWDELQKFIAQLKFPTKIEKTQEEILESVNERTHAISEAIRDLQGEIVSIKDGLVLSNINDLNIHGFRSW